jgi:hypothetical protein
MFFHIPPTWLPRLLFRSAFTLSLLLIVLVIVSPLVDNGDAQPEGWTRLLALFAHDAAIRRTALASAFGLMVTACVFFRGPTRPAPRNRRRTTAPPPPSVAGA